MKILDETGDLWLSDVERSLSPNRDQRPSGIAVDLLVIHAISLPPGEYGGEYIQQLFTNTINSEDHPYFEEIHHLRVSAHLLIRRDGRVIQFVPFNQRAWHAGASEYCGRQQCNDFSIGIELEGCDEDPFTDNQYQELAKVTKVIRSYWPSIDKRGIVGHSDIAPERKTDPGPRFDWCYYRELAAIDIS